MEISGSSLSDVFEFSYSVSVPLPGGQAKLVECESVFVRAIDEERAREWAVEYLGDEFPKSLLLELTLQSINGKEI